jgi:MFS family permease
MSERKERPAGSADIVWPLHGAAFATGLSLGIAWTAMPFVLVAMGGTKAHVGYAPAVNSLAYMAALLVTGSLLGHLDVRRATRTATVVAFLAAALMVVAVLGGKLRHADGRLTWVWVMIAAGGLGGAAMALFWPFLMGWVSASLEGRELNRRLGRYNGSWSSGGVIGPVIGAWLVEQNPLWPMLAAVLCFVVSFLLLGLARRDAGQPYDPSCANGTVPAPCDARVLADFRWMSRIALFCAWASFAIARSQFALLFTSLGHSESQFGVYLTTIALCNFLTLIAGGRWAFWHFRAPLLIGAQAMMLVTLLMIIFGRTLGVFYLSAVILGLAFGFAYSSHLFYGASASRKRSVRMVIHEMVISLGISVGSGAGGYLAKNVGLYAPYWFAVALVALGLALQLALHAVSRARVAAHRPVSPATETEPAEGY